MLSPTANAIGRHTAFGERSVPVGDVLSSHLVDLHLVDLVDRLPPASPREVLPLPLLTLQ